MLFVICQLQITVWFLRLNISLHINLNLSPSFSWIPYLFSPNPCFPFVCTKHSLLIYMLQSERRNSKKAAQMRELRARGLSLLQHSPPLHSREITHQSVTAEVLMSKAFLLYSMPISTDWALPCSRHSAVDSGVAVMDKRWPLPLPRGSREQCLWHGLGPREDPILTRCEFAISLFIDKIIE